MAIIPENGILLSPVQLPEKFSSMAANADDQGSVPRQGVRAATMTGVIRPKGHLGHIEKAFRYLSALDEGLCRFFDGHVDGGGIADRRHDQVGVGDEASLVRLVVMDEHSSRRFDDAHTFGRRLGGDAPDVRICDVFVFE